MPKSSPSLSKRPERFLQSFQSPIFDLRFQAPIGTLLGIHGLVPKILFLVLASIQAVRAHVHTAEQAFLGAFYAHCVEVLFGGGGLCFFGTCGRRGLLFAGV